MLQAVRASTNLQRGSGRSSPPPTRTVRRETAPAASIGNQSRLRRLSAIHPTLQPKLEIGAADYAAAPPQLSRKSAACDVKEQKVRHHEVPPTETLRLGRIAADSAELPLSTADIEPGVDLAQGPPPAPADTTDVAENKCCQLRSFAASDDTYVDTATDTRKNIKFTVAVEPGSDPKKCVMVNWIQGTAKNKDGTFRKVQMFEKTIDYNLPTMRIDSLDKDPVYWSNSAGRWNYQFTIGTGDVFFATDSPGPQVWVDGIDYDLKFKMCVHCVDDVSATSDESGSGVKNPLKCIDWVFKAKYDAAAKKFTH